jgi:hypothetical protein
MLRRLRDLIRRLKKRPPAEPPPRIPYAEVAQPKKPRKPNLSGAVALAEPDEE